MRTAIFHRSVHLPEDQLQTPSETCILCNQSGTRVFTSELQAEPKVDLLQCTACNGYSASRMPTSEALSRYYSGYYEQNRTTQKPKVTLDSPQRFARHIARMVVPAGEEIRIVDYGGGDGTISLLIAKEIRKVGSQRADITVVDYNTVPASSDDPNITIRCTSTLEELTPRTSDVVIASAVLEHVPDMISVFEKLLDLLSEKGTLYIRTPAVASFVKLAAKLGFKLDFTFPAHVHDLGQEFWEASLQLCGREKQFTVTKSCPSLVETNLKEHPLTTVAAHLFKAPWRVLGRRYKFVGGWEVFIRRKTTVGMD